MSMRCSKKRARAFTKTRKISWARKQLRDGEYTARTNGALECEMFLQVSIPKQPLSTLFKYTHLCIYQTNKRILVILTSYNKLRVD